MDEAGVRSVLDAMRESSAIGADTRLELDRLAIELDQGQLEPDDRNYIAALAKKLGMHPPARSAPDPKEASEPGVAAQDTPIEQDLRKRIKVLQRKGRAAVADRDRLRDQVRSLEAELVVLRAADGDHQKFALAKRAFAQLYHPNSQAHQGLERTVRTEVFKEFWAILERIEKGERPL